MFEQKSDLEILEAPKARCCNLTYLVGGAVGGVVLTLLLGASFWIGRQSAYDVENTTWNGIPSNRVPPELLNATATHGGSNLAVCTALVGDDAEGFFALDFLTGNLQGWVYYPRQRQFGGLFMTNVLNTPVCMPEYNGVLNSAPNATFGVANTAGVLQCVPLPPRMSGIQVQYKF